MLSTAVLMLLLITVFMLPIVWRCTHGFCSIAVDSDLLFYVDCILLFNDGVLLMARKSWLLQDDVRIVAANNI